MNPLTYLGDKYRKKEREAIWKNTCMHEQNGKSGLKQREPSQNGLSNGMPLALSFWQNHPDDAHFLYGGHVEQQAASSRGGHSPPQGGFPGWDTRRKAEALLQERPRIRRLLAAAENRANALPREVTHQNSFWRVVLFKKQTAKLGRILMSKQQLIEFSLSKKTHASS